MNITTQVGDWHLQLRGRADGLLIREDCLLVEEVKSLALSSTQIDLLTLDEMPLFVDQISLYGLALANEDKNIVLRLVLISLQDDGWREVTVPFNTEKIRKELTSWIESLSTTAAIGQKEAQAKSALAEKICFPYQEKRESQSRLIEQIATGLEQQHPLVAMAPTGTGKTIAALFPALQYALRHNSRLWFTTAKRTQQEMACKSFTDIIVASGLKGRLHAVAMAPKEELCPTGHLLCSPLVCPYLRDFKQRLAESRLLEKLCRQNDIITSADLLSAGELMLCPYELAVCCCQKCDLIVADYNYLFDLHPFRGATHGEQENPPVVIIDEAHNLFDRVRKIYSPVLAMADLAVATNLCRLNCLKKDASPQLTLEIEGVSTYHDTQLGERLDHFLQQIRDYIEKLLAKGPDEENPKQDGCWRLTGDYRQLSAMSEEAAELLIRYSLFRKLARLTGPLDTLQNVLYQIIRIADLALAEEDEMVPYLQSRHGQEGLGIICLNPAHRLSARHSRHQATIAISATLSPLAYYADILGLAPFNPQTIEVVSPFPEENRLIVIDPGVSTIYNRRQDNYKKIAQAINTTVSRHKGNYIAFFPSFQFLSAVEKELSPDSYCLLAQKAKMGSAERNLFLDKLKTSQGNLLLAVMGGIFSEGIDLPGEALVGAIIVGPALPQVGFERSLICNYFQETMEAGFAYGMLFPGMQKVIQAAGRVIRTMEDRGIIVLLDSRFAREPYCQALPSWWYHESVAEIITSDLSETLRLFWEEPRNGTARIIRKELTTDDDYGCQYWPEYN